MMKAQDQFDPELLVIEDPLIKSLWDSVWVMNKQFRYFETFPLLYQLEALAVEKNEPQILGNVLETIGSLLKYKGELSKAKEYLFKSYKAYEDNGQLEDLSLIMSGISNIEQSQGNISKAFEYSYKAKNLAQHSGKNAFVTAHNDLGALYHLNGKYDSAYYYRKIVLDGIEEKDSIHFNKANINMGNTLVAILDYEKATEYYSTALKFANPKKYALTYGHTLGRMGQLEYLKGDYNAAESTLSESLGLLEKAKNSSIRLYTFYPQYANVLIKNHKLNEAKSILEKAAPLVQDQNNELKIEYYFPKWELAIMSKERDESTQMYELIKPLLKEEHVLNKVRFYQLESQHFSLLGETTKALNSLQNHSSIKDSLNNLRNVKAIENLEIKYDSEKKANEITRLELEDQLNQTQINQQRFAIGGLLGGVGLLGLLLYRIFGQNKRINAQNAVITDALADKETLLREIHHRVKNNLQVISSLLGIQSLQIKDVKAKEAIQEGRNRVHSMSLIHQNLYKKDNLTGIEMRDYMKKLSTSIISSYSLQPDQVEVEQDIEDMTLDVETVVPIGLITNELLTNSLKYAFPDNRKGVITIKLREQSNQLQLKISDNGIGLDPDQLKLKEENFGHSLIRAFRNKLDATIDIHGDNGTEVTIVMNNYKIYTS